MNKVKNLAETALYGRDVGGTDFILNGKRIKTSDSFHGRTKAEAAGALFNAMGGTPDEIADQLFDALVESVNAYHSTPEGGPVVCDSDSANADESCSTSSVKCLNPS